VTPPTASPEPIRHLVVLGHPSESSFNRAVAETYCAAVREAGQTATLRDLYALGFDPLLKAWENPGAPGVEYAPDVATEVALLRASDAVVLVYPIWFGMPPAIVKGYVDRVFGAGFSAKEIRKGVASPLLGGKRLLSLSTSAATLPWLDARGQWQALRQAFDSYLVEAFGMRSGEHVHFDAIVENLQERYVYENLERVRGAAQTLCATLLDDRHRATAAAALARSGSPGDEGGDA